MDLKTLYETCEHSVISQWAENKKINISKPWVAYISTNNICNNKCKVCAYPFAMREDKGNMSFDLFVDIVSKLPDSIKKVYLQKQGEPFINKNLERFIQYLSIKRPDIHIAMHTNGILAKRDRIQKVLPFIGSMGISISAISPEIYKTVHGFNHFERVNRNLKDISDLLLNMPKGTKPHVFIDYIYQKSNSNEKEEDVVAYFKKRYPGISSVDFHWVYNFQGEIEEGNLEIYDKLEHYQFPVCIFPWCSITFCYDGKVSYCFVEPRENKFLGDISKQNFDEIWNGKDFSEFRENMLKHNFTWLEKNCFYCHKCSWLWSMKSQSPRNLVSGHFNNKLILLKDSNFGDIINSDEIEIFKIGANYYLMGEIHKSIGCFNTILKTSHNLDIINYSQKMIKKCNFVLKKYKYLSIWKEKMLQEGITSSQKECRYYLIE